jgi:hypothetical protein
MRHTGRSQLHDVALFRLTISRLFAPGWTERNDLLLPVYNNFQRESVARKNGGRICTAIQILWLRKESCRVPRAGWTDCSRWWSSREPSRSARIS